VLDDLVVPYQHVGRKGLENNPAATGCRTLISHDFFNMLDRS
jgi:hypothetical protein